ncbi:uncharacterized AAA domain-containing protein C16E9.10c-like isoform X3 [Tachysurus fulvidraco]|uniref:uncharacterized AAA domain-containing protein C16E9.10c-like isoform X3 n=1 Tax=Tachysurus fulvidraco TaxID=1234273 RepID=UPI001FED318B|nr:uncharacterized AAA domain-containing protein C16E9.10c-like isoform X3 [Tachysurus fulvidraco]XP_047671713.1 uncharacterized AAA domain-containing protein C16E9.10c-like isoform X3 [Tachysurus fulvidraco]XP_047671714.1 uncharacterized AAA domain-containing protein C16E9.10c-like isoform X3 [Tachysurus fulvidraco]XP_047671715.1 uncharacterized AAA domain-containing protein C16E9.10c-like isoform X3 [Tachysurus fulvidraco]
MTDCKRMRTSKVWESSTKLPTKNAVVCNTCKAELAFHGSTTCMLEHLKRKHPGTRGGGESMLVKVNGQFTRCSREDKTLPPVSSFLTRLMPFAPDVLLMSVRVLYQLLTEMDGLETRRQVFIMAATNRPDIINPAFLRPGRFNKKLYVDFPSPEDRHAILLTITKGATKPRLDPDVSSEEIARDELCDCFTTGSCRRNCVNLSLGSRRVDGEFSIFKINIFWTSGA